MSVATESPLNSSSSEDFAALLEDELDSGSSDASPDDDTNDADASITRVKRCKVEESANIEDAKGSTSYELSEQNLGLAVKDSCPHRCGFIKGLCIMCGMRTDDGTGIALGYIHKDLRLASDEISRLRNADVRALLRQKKLYLVLDLDHTLLNSTRIDDISSDEEYLMSQTDSLQDIAKGSLFRLDMMRMVTKLRPHVRAFLQEASNMFEMYIYTMGERAYALKMADLLDPAGLYFHSRVISQADCTQRHQKGLDVVLGEDRAVLILDDTEAVWQRHKDNLILMERYHFFSSSCRQFGFNCKSLSELKSDENESDGALVTVLGVLRRIHSKFFDLEQGDDLSTRDVRQVLKSIRKEVLKDCKIMFTRVFPTKIQAANHHLWKMAELLGATCTTELDSSITHVVSADAGTDKSRWALREGKSLVNPRWIEATNYFWHRQPEDQFPVNQSKNK